MVSIPATQSGSSSIQQPEYSWYSARAGHYGRYIKTRLLRAVFAVSVLVAAVKPEPHDGTR